MIKTSVYLPEHQKDELDRVAIMTGRSHAELIREGIEQVIESHLRRRPRMKARVHDPALVGRTDDLLDGLGE